MPSTKKKNKNKDKTANPDTEQAEQRDDGPADTARKMELEEAEPSVLTGTGDGSALGPRGETPSKKRKDDEDVPEGACESASLESSSSFELRDYFEFPIVSLAIDTHCRLHQPSPCRGYLSRHLFLLLCSLLEIASNPLSSAASRAALPSLITLHHEHHQPPGRESRHACRAQRTHHTRDHNHHQHCFHHSAALSTYSTFLTTPPAT